MLKQRNFGAHGACMLLPLKQMGEKAPFKKNLINEFFSIQLFTQIIM